MHKATKYMVGTLLVAAVSASALAQDLDSVSDLVSDIWQLNHKELMIKQGLSNVALDSQRFDMFNEQGYTPSFTPTGAVVSTVGTQVMCIIDGRFTMQETRFDSSNETLIANFKLDDQHDSVICTDFTDNPATTQCSIRHSKKNINKSVDSTFFRNLCVEQMQIVMEAQAL